MGIRDRLVRLEAQHIGQLVQRDTARTRYLRTLGDDELRAVAAIKFDVTGAPDLSRLTVAQRRMIDSIELPAE